MKRILRWPLIVFLCVVLTLTFPAATLASGGRVHVVQPGQTLLTIAYWYGVDMSSLARANGIVNPNHIYVGQRLVIPNRGGYVPSGGAYIVKVGDTLHSIARRYGCTVWALASANGIYDLNHIYVGQRLVIPGAAPAPTPRPQPTPKPQPSTGPWRGEYYAGTEPSGGPVFVRHDAAVNFHWGLTSPDTRLCNDEFSVRWTRTINFIGGVYRFKVRVDDGVRIWVDDRMVLDAWKVQPETDYAVDVTITPGHHVVTIDYFDQADIATIQFSFARLGTATPTPCPTAPCTPKPSPTPVPGDGTAPFDAWYGEYFGNPHVSGSPAATRLDPAIGFEWGNGAPIGGVAENFFSARWTRRATFYEDNYAFCAMSDDGVRMYLDGTIILDEWHGSNSVSYCAEVDVSKGEHTVRVEYYEDGGNALIYVWWERR